MIVGVFEAKFLVYAMSTSIHILISILVLVQAITYIGYCQVSLAISYVLIWLYFTIRFSIDQDINIMIKVEVSVYFFMTLVAIFAFQRYKLQIRREIFLQKCDTEEILELFHKLMRVYHDGIIVTHNKEIVFKNKQFSDLLLL